LIKEGDDWFNKKEYEKSEAAYNKAAQLYKE
jgi:hypothetical protein